MDTAKQANVTANESSTPIEDLPLAERLKLADTFEPMKNPFVGMYVDARDTVSTWCVAEVLTISVNEVKVSFDGWSSKYDEEFRLKSSRIAPFRMYSKGYTGQIKNPLRRMEYSAEWIDTQMKKIKEVIESDFKVLKTAFEITQYLRGKVFIYVDFLMANEYKNPQEECKKAIEFLKLVIKLFVRWMELFPKYKQSFLEGEQYTKLYLVDRNVAFASCGYELYDMMKSIFCLCHRSLQFYYRYDLEIDPLLKPLHNEIKTSFVEKRKLKPVEVIKEELEQGKEFVFGQFINFFNYFASINGLEAVYNIIGGETGKALPLHYIAMVLDPFKNIKFFVKKEIAEKMVEEGKNAFFDKIIRIDNKELKDLNKELMMRAMGLMKGFLGIVMNEDEANKIVETHEMMFSLRLIKCPYLEKRLKGISDIKNLIERIEMGASGMAEGLAGVRFISIPRESNKRATWITAEYLADWIQKNKLLSEILNSDAHSEIIKRSSSILMFLAKQNALKAEDLELLWHCQEEKHEDMVLSVYEAIKEILPCLTSALIDFIFNKIKSMQLEQITEKTISFMCDFTLRAFKKASFEKEKPESKTALETIDEEEGPTKMEIEKPVDVTIQYDKEESEKMSGLPLQVHKPTDGCLYCIPILYEITQDESNTPANLVEFALKALQDTLSHQQCEKFRPQYLFLTLQRVKFNKSVPQNLFLALFLLKCLKQLGSTMGNAMNSTKGWIEKLKKEGFQLIPMIMESLKIYETLVQEKLDKTITMENINHTALVGKMRHSLNIDERLLFLELILQNGEKDNFGKENILMLWDLCMNRKYSIIYETGAFLNFISGEKVNSLHKLPMIYFSQKDNLLFFEIICQHSSLAENKMVNYFQCISKLFKLVNLEKGVIDIVKGKARVKSFSDLIGLEELWKIVCSVSFADEKQKEKLIEMLVDIYVYFHDSLQDKKYDIYSMFIDKCFVLMQKAETENNENGICTAIKLTLQFLETLYGKKYVPKEEDEELKAFYSHKYPVMVTLKPENKTVRLDVGTSATVGELKKLIAEALGIPFCLFQISGLNKTEYEPDDYDEELRSLGWSTNFIVTRCKETKKGLREPKCLIADNEEYMGYLFKLLSKEGTIYGDSLWQLITSLPRNEKISKSILELKVPSENKEEYWNKLFDSSSTHKLLYSLQILEELLANEEIPEKTREINKYFDDFTKKGGLNHIYKAFLNLPIGHLSQQLSRQCYSILMKLIYSIKQKYEGKINEFIPNYSELKPKATQKTLTLLNAFAEFSITQKEQTKLMKSPKKFDMAEYYTRGRGKKEVKKNTEDAEAENKAKQEKRKKELEESESFMKGWVLIKGPDFMKEVLQYQNLKELLLRGIILSDNDTLKQQFGQEIIKIKNDYPIINDSHPYIVLLPILLGEMLNASLTKESKTEWFYACLKKLLSDYSAKELLQLKYPFPELITNLTEIIIFHASKEQLVSDNDFTLAGLLDLLSVLLAKFPQFKATIGQGKKLTNHVLHDCLYEYPNISKIKSTNSSIPPKCKSLASRRAALNLLCVLSRNTPENLSEIISYLAAIHRNGAWRTGKSSDWSISGYSSDKSLTGYVGIKNLGCICYMISLFQQLYMIPTFRNDILASAEITTTSSSTPLSENPLFQTQCIFAALNESMKKAYNPKPFCQAFKDYEGKSLDTLEQMDVDEFFNLFMDRIENLLKGTPQAKTINYHFGGLFTNQFIGKECPHRKSRKEPFMAINLQVKNKKSLQQCLESYVEGELLQGNNAYFCEACDKKVATLSRSCIKRLPRHLIFVLKRFEFDYDAGQKFKVNDYCEFPHKLDMEPYTEEGLAKKDIEKEKEKARKEGKEYIEDPNNSIAATLKPKE